MSPSLQELSACCVGGGSCGGDAGSAGSGEGTGAAGEVFCGCFFGADCFLGDLFGARSWGLKGCLLGLEGLGLLSGELDGSSSTCICDAIFFNVCILLEGRVGDR